MSVVITIRCAGHRCEASGTVESGTTNSAALKLRYAGWSAARGDGGVYAMYCPACAVDFIPPPEKKCPQRHPCGLAVADLVGHDGLGHRISYRLARGGYTDVGRVMDLADEGDLDLLLGQRSIARVYEVLNA
ncbi:hypothetical protein [Streptomyces sp. NPDC088360]|uniref:hypothetical protein n=1 Tax=Streptomyces sp. NPDC088360 TaxID=3154515 RepID=UPI00344C8754